MSVPFCQNWAVGSGIDLPPVHALGRQGQHSVNVLQQCVTGKKVLVHF